MRISLQLHKPLSLFPFSVFLYRTLRRIDLFIIENFFMYSLYVLYALYGGG
jgi:hypothetical protein